MNLSQRMRLVYGDLSRASVRFASRFHITQERIRCCTDEKRCKLHACPRCLRVVVRAHREAAREWLRAAKGLELEKIILKAPVLATGEDLDSTISGLLQAARKVLRGKKVWSGSLRGHLAAIRIEVIPRKEGSKYYRFRLQVRLVVAGDAEQVELGTRWKQLLGAEGIPRRGRLRDLVGITGVTSTRTRRRCARWLLSSSSAILCAMPKKPEAASSYIEVLPRLFKVMVMSPGGYGFSNGVE